MNQSKHKSSNASGDKSLKEKSFRAVSSRYNKHNISQTQMLVSVAAYQRKIKGLLRVNKTLARALQELRHDCSVQNDLIIAYSKDSNQILLAQEKLKNMSISFQMLIGNLSEALLHLSSVKCVRDKFHLSSVNDNFQKISQEPEMSNIQEESTTESSRESNMGGDEEEYCAKTSTKQKLFSFPKSNVPSNRSEAPQSENQPLGATSSGTGKRTTTFRTTLQDVVSAFPQAITSQDDNNSWATTSHSNDSAASHATIFHDDDEQAIDQVKTSLCKNKAAVQVVNKPISRKSLTRKSLTHTNKPAGPQNSLSTAGKSFASQNALKYIEEMNLSKSSAVRHNDRPDTASKSSFRFIHQQAGPLLPKEPDTQRMEVEVDKTQNKTAFDEMTEVYDVRPMLNAVASHKAESQRHEIVRDDEMTEMYDIRPFTEERKLEKHEDKKRYKKLEECCIIESPATAHLNLTEVNSLTPEPPIQEDPKLLTESFVTESPGTPRLYLSHRYSQSPEFAIQTDPVKLTESPTIRSKIPQKVVPNAPIRKEALTSVTDKQVTDKPNRRETFVVPQIPNVSSFTSRETFVVKGPPKELPRQDHIHADKRLTYVVPVSPVKTKPKSKVRTSPKTSQGKDYADKRLTYVVPISPVFKAQTKRKLPEGPKQLLQSELLPNFRAAPELTTASELPNENVLIPEDMELTAVVSGPIVMGDNALNSFKAPVAPEVPEVANSEAPSVAPKVPKVANFEAPMTKKPIVTDKTPMSIVPVKEQRKISSDNLDVLNTKLIKSEPVIPIADKSNKRKTLKRVSFISPKESLCKDPVKNQQFKVVKEDSDVDAEPYMKSRRSSRARKPMYHDFSSSESSISLSVSDSEYLPEKSDFPKSKRIPGRKSLHPGLKKSFVFTTKPRKQIPENSLESGGSHALNAYSYNESTEETGCNDPDARKLHKKSKKPKSANRDSDFNKKSKYTYNDKLQSLCQTAKQKKSRKMDDRVSESSSEPERTSSQEASTSSSDRPITSFKPSNSNRRERIESCLHAELSNPDRVSENFVQNVNTFAEQDEKSVPFPEFVKSKADRKTFSNKRQSSVESEIGDRGTRKREFSGVSERRSKKRATAEMSLPGPDDLNLHGKNSSIFSLPGSKYADNSLDGMLSSLLLDESELEYIEPEKLKNVSAVKRLTSSKRKSLAVGKKSIRPPGLISSDKQSEVSASSPVQKSSSVNDLNEILEAASSKETTTSQAHPYIEPSTSSTKTGAKKKKSKHVIQMKSLNVAVDALGQRDQLSQQDQSCEGGSMNTLAAKDSLSQVFGETPAKGNLPDSRISNDNILPSIEKSRRTSRTAIKSYKEPSSRVKMRREY